MVSANAAGIDPQEAGMLAWRASFCLIFKQVAVFYVQRVSYLSEYRKLVKAAC
jgi:hypothetical protein